jgi:hypothetical protein
LDDGNLLYATTEPGISVVGEFDPERGEYERVKRFEGDADDETTPLVTDAHDADLLGEHEMAMVDKGEGHERLLVYNLTSDRVAWEWRFGNHPAAFPDSGGGPPDDWTHVNDVEQVREDLFMLSVRNFDQVVFVNRTTDDIERTLGADDAYDVLKEQHNPDHLWGPNGEHTVLVADSLNDRVVEYRYRASEESWERVWSVSGFEEPRDVDRLQNGNTLVADRRGHRVVEIPPMGEAVWEVYTPFEPYDVERGDVDESTGPTMAEQSIEGQYDLSDDAGFSTAEVETCAADIFDFASPSLSPGGIDSFTTSEGTASGEDGPAGSDTGEDPRQEFPLLPTIIAAVVLLVLLVGWRWRQ